MTNPIQQLVDALRRYYNPLADECGDHCTHNCRECQARSAILAVESAEVETYYEISYYDDGNRKWKRALAPLVELEAAKRNAAYLLTLAGISKTEITRIDTYRTVEKEQ